MSDYMAQKAYQDGFKDGMKRAAEIAEELQQMWATAGDVEDVIRKEIKP